MLHSHHDDSKVALLKRFAPGTALRDLWEEVFAAAAGVFAKPGCNVEHDHGPGRSAGLSRAAEVSEWSEQGTRIPRASSRLRPEVPLDTTDAPETRVDGREGTGATQQDPVWLLDPDVVKTETDFFAVVDRYVETTLTVPSIEPGNGTISALSSYFPDHIFAPPPEVQDVADAHRHRSAAGLAAFAVFKKRGVRKGFAMPDQMRAKYYLAENSTLFFVANLFIVGENYLCAV